MRWVLLSLPRPPPVTWLWDVASGLGAGPILAWPGLTKARAGPCLLSVTWDQSHRAHPTALCPGRRQPASCPSRSGRGTRATLAFSRGHLIRTSSHESQSAAGSEDRVLWAVVPAGPRLLVPLCARPARALGKPHSWVSCPGAAWRVSPQVRGGFSGRTGCPRENSRPSGPLAEKMGSPGPTGLPGVTGGGHWQCLDVQAVA